MKKLVSLIGVGLAFASVGYVRAGDDILAEAKYYWRFDEDVNGNGKLDADDIRDVRKWGTKAASADTLKISEIKGNDLQPNGPTWVDTEVRQPGRGLRYPGKALRFTVDNRATDEVDAKGMVKTNSCPVGFTFANAAITGSVTVVWRCRADSFKSFDGFIDHAWLVNNGEDWGNVAGSNFGFRPVEQTGSATTGSPAVYFGRSELYANMVLETNVWYDVGISLKDTGDGGAKGIIVVCDSGNDKAYGAIKDQLWKPKFQAVEKLTLEAGSGAFTNEAMHATDIKIGAEVPGSRVLSGGANKGFAGDLQRIIMWDRALTETELIAAIRQPAQLFKVGLEDGKSGEFGDRGDITETYHAGLPETPWHFLPKSVDAANPELTMTVLATNDLSKMGNLLRVKAAEGAAGVTRLQPTINGTTLEPQDLAPLGEALWFVKPQTLVAGANNTIVFNRLAAGSTAESLEFDLIEMCGTWEIGVNNGISEEFSVENVAPNPCTAYPGSYAYGNVQRGIPTLVPDLTLRFYMPQNLLDYDYVFKTRPLAQGASNADRYVSDGKVKVKDQYPFRISLNGSEIYSTEGVANGTEIFIKIPAGTMTNGWNTILLTDRGGGYTYTDDQGKTQDNAYWICWDYHALEVQRPPRGMMILLR